MSRVKSVIGFPLVSAVLGGVVAVLGVLALGVGDDDGGTTTTVVQQAPVQQADGETGLTARDIYERDAPGVVFIRAQGVTDTTSIFGAAPEGSSTGSGFVVSKDGEIATNFHVVEGARRITVRFGEGKDVEAKLLGSDPSTDLALLKVEPKGLDLRPLRLGDSSKVKVGDPTLAIGNPFGLDRTLTTGVVSALQRRIEAPNRFRIDNVIQTDAAINPGNSGGPLLDATGRVIGVNSQIATGGGSEGNVGIGFAVPVNTVKDVLPQLESAGKVERAYLGVTGRTVDDALAPFNLREKEGVIVQSIEPGSPADKAGLRLGDAQAVVAGEPVVVDSDVILAVDGTKVTTADELVSAISRRKPGEKVKLTVSRGGDERDVSVELTTRPNELTGR